jgi:hypothetical protein
MKEASRTWPDCQASAVQRPVDLRAPSSIRFDAGVAIGFAPMALRFSGETPLKITTADEAPALLDLPSLIADKAAPYSAYQSFASVEKKNVFRTRLSPKRYGESPRHSRSWLRFGAGHGRIVKRDSGSVEILFVLNLQQRESCRAL